MERAAPPAPRNGHARNPNPRPHPPAPPRQPQKRTRRCALHPPTTAHTMERAAPPALRTGRVRNPGMRTRSSIVPAKVEDLPAVGPVLPILHKTSPHWIGIHVSHALMVILCRTNLPVPEVLLPDGKRPAFRPSARHRRFDRLDPILEFRRRIPARRAKQMHMIRHQHVMTDLPVIPRTPNGN